MEQKKQFSVYTLTVCSDKGKEKYCHWSKDLRMVIVKEGITITLNSEEIEQLVRTLPITVGGSY